MSPPKILCEETKENIKQNVKTARNLYLLKLQISPICGMAEHSNLILNTCIVPILITYLKDTGFIQKLFFFYLRI